MAQAGCGAPDQDADSAIPSGATVITGTVRRAGDPVPAAYVRLLDSSGEFTAEVSTGAAGGFRFYAAPGDWTLRALAAAGRGELPLTAVAGENRVTLQL